ASATGEEAPRDVDPLYHHVTVRAGGGGAGSQAAAPLRRARAAGFGARLAGLCHPRRAARRRARLRPLLDVRRDRLSCDPGRLRKGLRRCHSEARSRFVVLRAARLARPLAFYGPPTRPLRSRTSAAARASIAPRASLPDARSCSPCPTN